MTCSPKPIYESLRDGRMRRFPSAQAGGGDAVD